MYNLHLYPIKVFQVNVFQVRIIIIHNYYGLINLPKIIFYWETFFERHYVLVVHIYIFSWDGNNFKIL